MADLNGSWVPASQEEASFIMSLSALASRAYDDGVDQEAIAGGLAFMSGVVAMQDPDEETLEDLAEPPEETKRETCPDCGDDIEQVSAFIGGQCIVSPCGCNVRIGEVSGWVDQPGDDDD